MTGWRVVLPLVLLAVSLAGLVRSEGLARDWLPMLLVAIGGAVLAFGVSYLIGRREIAR